jgi:hypothetical protein
MGSTVESKRRDYSPRARSTIGRKDGHPGLSPNSGESFLLLDEDVSRILSSHGPDVVKTKLLEIDAGKEALTTKVTKVHEGLQNYPTQAKGRREWVTRA